MDLFNDLILLLDATVRVATPLIFAALAGLYSERSGVFDIGLEGKMLISAFAAAAIAAVSGSVLVGLAAGMLAGIMFALLHGFACITYRGNQIVSGVASTMPGSSAAARRPAWRTRRRSRASTCRSYRRATRQSPKGWRVPAWT